MANTDTAYRPQSIVARRVREERKRRGWSQKELARQLAELGYGSKEQQPTIARIESGKRAVPIDELFALAAALGTAPIFLLTPLDDEEPVAVTPRVTIPAHHARLWLRGVPVPALPDIDLAALPPSELFQLVRRQLERRLPSQVAWMSEAQMGLTEAAHEAVEQIRNPEREEAHSG